MEFYQSQLTSRKGNSQLQLDLAIQSHLRALGVEQRSTCEVHSPEDGLTKRLTPTLRTIEYFPSPAPHHHITKGLFTAAPFTQYIMPGYQEKLQDILKGKKYRRDTTSTIQK